jgi:hypothetical protein
MRGDRRHSASLFMPLNEYIAAALSPPRSDPANSQAFLLWIDVHNRNYVRSRIMHSSCWRRCMRPNVVGDFTRRRDGHNSEVLEEAHQLIWWPITHVLGLDRLQSGESTLLH